MLLQKVACGQKGCFFSRLHVVKEGCSFRRLHVVRRGASTGGCMWLKKGALSEGFMCSEGVLLLKSPCSLKE